MRLATGKDLSAALVEEQGNRWRLGTRGNGMWLAVGNSRWMMRLAVRK
jgi:hypothetical protein